MVVPAFSIDDRTSCGLGQNNARLVDPYLQFCIPVGTFRGDVLTRRSNDAVSTPGKPTDPCGSEQMAQTWVTRPWTVGPLTLEVVNKYSSQ